MFEEQAARILVAEDDEKSRRLLASILEACGHDVTYASDGLTALRLVQRDPFDLAIFDVMMPGLDGLAVTREVRSDPETSTLPIAIVTALSSPEDRQRALEAGADEYVSKPFHIVQIARLVTELRRKGKRRVGRYDLSALVGEGSSKRVFEAYDPERNQPVAVGMFHAEAMGEAAHERFRRESRSMMDLGEHPNVVTVYDAGEHRGQAYIVTELMTGGGVDDWLSAQGDGPVDLAGALEIARDVVRGLQFVHGHDVVHRDLKPSNVWLTSDGRAKIGDFGIALWVERTRLTQDGGAMMRGTVSYMPPEQVLGDDITPSADLYSLGVMLYEIVAGRPPFVAADPWAVAGQQLESAPAPPRTLNERCPAELDELILRLLAKRPQDRPRDATEVLDTLEAIEVESGATPVEVA